MCEGGHVKRIGLTGGIGSGKSTVARMLKEHGAVIIDADQISRELVEPGSPTLVEIVSEFGTGVLREDGSLNRGELAALAFGSPERTAALNAIMHPRIQSESAARIASAPPNAIVVYDMPLLVETNQQDLVDQVIVVDVPRETQVQRATSRGMDQRDVERRIQAQATRQERLAVADFVIDNSGAQDATREQVDGVWALLKAE